MHRLLRIRVLVPCGVSLFVLSGCLGSTPPTQFYLVPALTGGDTAPPVVGGPARPHAAVGPVTVPPYLDRPQIVTRTSRAKLAWPILTNGRGRWRIPSPGCCRKTSPSRSRRSGWCSSLAEDDRSGLPGHGGGAPVRARPRGRGRPGGTLEPAGPRREGTRHAHLPHQPGGGRGRL